MPFVLSTTCLAYLGTPSNHSSPLLAATPDTAGSEPEHKNTGNSAETEADIGSEFEDDLDDLEPRRMLDVYIKLKKSLYRRRPDLADRRGVPLKGSRKTKHVEQPAAPDAISRRLLSRIRRMESDILFDLDAAQDVWHETRLSLLKEEAERKKFQLELIEPSNVAFVVGTNSGTEETSRSKPADAAMDLGDFFASLPQETIDESTGATTLATSSADGICVVRDFGKWIGTGPRRVLEETSRARDSSVKVTSSVISTASFSNRQSIKVSWSKPQQPPDTTDIPGVLVEHDYRTFQATMTAVSTPDKLQSEAFISTVALFLLFAASPKEEKAHLRLPSIFRDLWQELVQAREERLNAIHREDVREIRRLVEERSRDTGPDDTLPCPKADPNQTPTPNIPESTIVSDVQVDEATLRSIWASKSSSPVYTKMLATRKRLPIWNFKDQLLSTIEKHQAVIVCGETGCGKSTQVPAFILEKELSLGRDCKIYCTEPRRISAISLARRVSEELGERKSDVGTSRSLVGYSIRLENQVASSTKLVYATTGIVMRMLEDSETFQNITHLVLDEVHERTIDSDFLLIVLRRLLKDRPRLRVVLMSATVDAEKFARYLGRAPVLNVPGRTFPVQTQYLEDAVEVVISASNMRSLTHTPSEALEEDEESHDAESKATHTGDLNGYSARTKEFVAQFNEYRINYELIVGLLETVATVKEYEQYSKAILVFLPGLAEIRRLNNMLIGHPVFSRKWQIFPMHSSIASDAQEAAFPVPPPGFRKVVLATNIAETGITIPDITCVIDTGKHREMR